MAATEIFGIDIHDVMADLKKAIEEGTFKINSLSLIRELELVKYGPDGRVDPATIGSEVRATARAFIARRQTLELEAQKAKSKEQRISDLMES